MSIRIVKPLRLGLLHRPFRWRQRDCLAFTVVAHVSLAGRAALLHDNLAWGLHGEEPHVDALFDQFMPKPVPEFLVSGYAHTLHNPNGQAGVAAVSAQLGDKEKRLTVYGDRYWVDGRPTAPLPFERMPLGRGLAFGGPDYAENPAGRGHAAERVNGVQVQRLPNIESDVQPIHSPRQAPARPAGMGMVDLAAPSQVARLGGVDAHYLERDHPGLPSQADWQYFNVAPLGQRWPDRDRLPPALPYLLRHLHPDKPVQQGTLPDAHARCFVVRKGAGAQGAEPRLEEVGLRLTTVWFFPHRDSAVLLYHGSTLVADDHASDITHAMPAYESTGRERPLAHFDAVLAARCADRTGMLHTFREADLITEELVGPGFDTAELELAPTGPLVDNQQRRVAALQAQRDDTLREMGRSPDEFAPDAALAGMPQVRHLADLPEFHAQMERKGAELEAAMASQRQKMLDDLRGQPASPQTAQLIERLTGATPTAFDLAGMTAEIRKLWTLRPADAAGAMTAAQAEAGIKRIYLSAASFCGPAATLDGLRAAALRTSVQEQYARDRDLRGLDLTGADLSGLDLRGADLRGSFLEGVDLTGTLLDGADLRETVMVRTRLVKTSLRGCRCDGANFSTSSARHASFAGLQAEDAMWFELDWEDCDLSGARFKNVMLRQAVIQRCGFEHASLEDVTLLECTARSLRLSHANVRHGSWIKSILSEAVFDHAVLDQCGAIESDLSGASFAGARLDACIVLSSSTMNDANFNGATVKASNFRGTPIARGQFQRARMHDSDFSECLLEGASLFKASARECLFHAANLRAAVLRDADLIGASLQGADLRACDLTAAVLFGAELSRIVTDASTVFDGVLAERANVHPRATEAA